MQTKKKILIVDDEKELAGLVSLHISRSGYDVLIAFDGEEAVNICRKEKPDLIVLDLLLPKMDGFAVCRIIKEDPQTKDTAVIMLSALSQLDDRLKGLELGADDFVAKPFSPRELVMRIKRILGDEAVNLNQGGEAA